MPARRHREVYVLDAGGARAPLGVAGELYLGGAGLARAYHGRPDLTSAAFAPHPDAEGARLYKTGDRVRLLPSGELEFLGRVDSQVKVRGYRIELGEIESLLAQEPLVEQAVVAVRGSLDAARLVAYVTPRNGQRPSATELRASLRTRLPEFMVPSAVSVLDAFPLTPSGKIDRARLPEPADVRDEDEPFRAPGAGLEAAVAGIWQDVLGVPRVGVSDNFFDLGGTSLLAARVHARIEALAPGAVSLVDLFQLPTVRALTARLAGTTAPQGAARQRGALAAGRARLRAAADRRAAPGPGTGARS
jgi:non-ribosomal peptide synthetase component F